MGGRAEVPDRGGKPDGSRKDGSHVPKDHGTDGGATRDHPRRRVGGRDVPEGLDWVGHVVYEGGVNLRRNIGGYGQVTRVEVRPEVDV